MNGKSLTGVIVAIVLAVGSFFAYQDYQFRKTYGAVTEVGLFNYDQEVEKVGDKPVLIYFYRQEEGVASDAEMDVTKSFAWWNAGKVKVVAINVAHLENLPLAIAHAALRQPAFVFMHNGQELISAQGKFVSGDELNRLYEQLKNAKPAAQQGLSK